MSIIVDKISHVYEAGTGFERKALDNVSFAIEDGEFIGLIGHTGSGKSTLIQHLNGLLKATSGHIYYNGKDIYEAGYDMRELRKMLDWYSSIQSISYSKQIYLRMYALDLRIWAYPDRNMR